MFTFFTSAKQILTSIPPLGNVKDFKWLNPLLCDLRHLNIT